jgi:hypothetical protein
VQAPFEGGRHPVGVAVVETVPVTLMVAVVVVVVEVEFIPITTFPLKMIFEVPIRTVPMLELQQARESLSCPQQKTPYSPHGVITASPVWNSSARSAYNFLKSRSSCNY